MEEIKEKTILKIFAFVFSIFFLIIAINTLFLNKTIQINFSIAIMLLGTIINYSIIHIFSRIAKKYEKILEIKLIYKIIIGLLIFILQLIISNLVYAHCGWDCGGVIDNAYSIYKGGELNTEYFASYPNNIALLILLKYLYCFVGVFQNIDLQNMYWITVVYNVIMIDIAAIFTILTAKKVSGNKTAYLVFIFMLPLIIFTPHMIVPYTDTITLFIPISLYYFYLKIKDNTKMKYLYIFIEAILLVGGYFLKPTCIIIGIAILLAELLYIKINKDNILTSFKNLGITTLILILGVGISLGCYSYVKEKNISKYISKEEIDEKSIPATHFLMMGMQEGIIEDAKGKNNIMYGAYSGEDLKSTMEIKGRKEKTKYHIEKVKERLQNFGIFGYLQFVYNKVTWILSDGTFYYGAEGTFFLTEPYNKTEIANKLHGFVNLNSKKYQIITANIMQITWTTLIIGLIMTYKSRGKNVNILKFSIIGIILFIVLFEGRSRYLYNYVPIFIIVGTLGIKNAMEIIQSKFQNNKREEQQYLIL